MVNFPDMISESKQKYHGVKSLGYYLHEWPVGALSQVDAYTWTGDSQAPGQMWQTSDLVGWPPDGPEYAISMYREICTVLQYKWHPVACNQVISPTCKD